MSLLEGISLLLEIDPATTTRVQEEWNKWAHEVPFVVLKSPYRSVIRPLLEYIDDVAQVTHDDMVTVIIPEFVTSKWRYNLLHNQTALLIRTALLFKRGKVVTSRWPDPAHGGINLGFPTHG